MRLMQRVAELLYPGAPSPLASLIRLRLYRSVQLYCPEVLSLPRMKEQQRETIGGRSESVEEDEIDPMWIRVLTCWGALVGLFTRLIGWTVHRLADLEGKGPATTRVFSSEKRRPRLCARQSEDWSAEAAEHGVGVRDAGNRGHCASGKRGALAKGRARCARKAIVLQHLRLLLCSSAHGISPTRNKGIRCSSSTISCCRRCDQNWVGTSARSSTSCWLSVSSPIL